MHPNLLQFSKDTTYFVSYIAQISHKWLYNDKLSILGRVQWSSPVIVDSHYKLDNYGINSNIAHNFHLLPGVYCTSVFLLWNTLHNIRKPMSYLIMEWYVRSKPNSIVHRRCHLLYFVLKFQVAYLMVIFCNLTVWPIFLWSPNYFKLNSLPIPFIRGYCGSIFGNPWPIRQIKCLLICICCRPEPIMPA